MTAHPTSEWTLQQLREAIPGERGYRFLIHDRDSIFSAELEVELTQRHNLGALGSRPRKATVATFRPPRRCVAR